MHFKIQAQCLFIIFSFIILFSFSSFAQNLAGNAAAFDGFADYINMGEDTSLEVSEAITLEAWIYPTGNGATSFGGIILNKEGEYEFARFADGTIRWAFANASPAWNWVNTNVVAPLNTWTHVAIVYDLPNAKTYLNGALVHTWAIQGNIGDFHANSDQLRAGGRQIGNQFFDGFIDEARVWKVVRTEAQIISTLNDTLSANYYTTPDSGLIGYWRMDDLDDLGINGDGNDDVRDYSSNSNHGDLNGNTNLQPAAWHNTTLLAYFPFNGNANDESGNGNSGTVFGASLTADRFGVTASAYLFSGQDYIELPGGSSDISPYTVSAWFKTAENAGTIFSFRENPQSSDYYMLRILNTGQLRFFYTNGPGANGDMLTDSVFNDNNWHHVVAVRDGPRTGQLYIDGELVAVDSNNGGSWGGIDQPHVIAIGRNAQGSSDYFSGSIDDIRTYSLILTPSEIKALYEEGGWPNQPLALDDNVTTFRDEAVTVNVLRNDSHPAQSSLTISAAFPATFGIVSIGPGDSSITYTPTNGFTGLDQFTYIISDNQGLLDTAQVNVHVIQGPPVTDGLVAYYPFNGNANDESGNGNNGTAFGAVLAEDRNNTPNSAFQFDGVDDFIECGDGLNEVTVPFTLAAWIYNDDPTAWHGIFSSDDNPDAITGNYHGFWAELTTGNQLFVSFGDGSGPFISDRRSKATITPLPLDQWVHVAMVVNGPADIQLFVDGQEVDGGYSGSGGTMNHNTYPIRIGLRSRHGPRWFSGSIDDVFVYDRNLSVEEIALLYGDSTLTLPVARDDAATTTLNTSITVNVLANDFHTGNAALSIIDFLQPFNGSVTQSGDSSFIYTPQTGFTGNDGFEYFIQDPEGNRDTASVSIAVTPAFADLIVTEVQTSVSVISGQPFTVTWAVTNQGSQGTDVPEWYDRVYLSATSIFIPQQAIQLGDFQNFSYLSPGEGYLNTKNFTMPLGFEGDYYVFVESDIRRQLPESNENNNRGRSATGIDVNLPDLPDLQVTIAQVIPEIPNAGNTITIEWTVTNAGSGTTMPENWFDTVFYSEDSTLNFFFPALPPNTIVYNDPEALKVERISALAPQESYTASGQFTLPHNLESGDTVYFFVHTDYNASTPGAKANERGDIYEHTGDFNNIHRIAVPLTNTPPDLEVTDVSGFPASGSVAENVPISFTVANNGLDDTFESFWQDRVYVSSNAVFHPDSLTLVGTFSHNGILARFDSYTVNETVTLPGNIKGDYYFHVETDAGNLVFEGSSQEDNNTNSSTSTITVLHPDLFADSLLAAPLATVGGNIDISWTVTNNGSGSVFQGPWRDRIYLSNSANFDPDSAVAIGVFNIAESLAPAESYNRQETVKIPAGFSGQNWLFLESDWLNEVFEDTANANNLRRATAATTVFFADLAVDAIAIPDTGSSGNSFTVSWAVKNIGSGAVLGSRWQDDLYLSTQATFVPDSATLIGSKTHEFDLAVDSLYNSETTITLPNGLQGDYYLFVITDARETVFENDLEENNRQRSATAAQIQLSPWADLLVSSITLPDSANVGDQLRIDYTVKNSGAARTRNSSWKDYIYSSDQPVWNNSATLLQTISHNGRLNPEESYNETVLIFLNSNFQGERYFHVFTNGLGNEYEHPPANENNISSSSALQINGYPPVDLAADILAFPDSAESGESISLQWSVENLGLAPTLSPSWRDGFYLSADTLFDVDTDIFIDAFPRSGTLVPGQSYQLSRNVVLPSGISGNYFLIVRPDIDGRIEDSNPANDLGVSSHPLPIRLSPPVDLAAITMTVNSNVIAGQPIEIITTVENQGEGSISNRAWNDAVYLSRDAALSSDDRFLGFTRSSATLALQESYSDTVSYDLPNYLSGNYYLIFRTDSQNEVYEHLGEENNMLSETIFLTLPPPADLIVSNIAIPDSALSGDSILVRWTIRNIGNNPASGWLRDAVYVSADILWGLNDPLVGSDYRLINLPPGAAQERVMRVKLSEAILADSSGNLLNPLPGVVPGSYHAIVRTDIRNNIREDNLENNRKASANTLSVNVPLLSLGTADTTEIVEGQMIYYRVDAMADLDLKFVLKGDSGDASNELYIAYDRVPTLTDYDHSGIEPFAANQEVLIPGTENGTYYLMIYGRNQATGFQEINISTEALPFSVNDMFPNYGGRDGRVTTTLKGAGFRDSTKVFLRISPDSLLQAEKVFFINSSEVNARWNLENIPLGLYDVIIQNPSTLLSSNFEEILLPAFFSVEELIENEIVVELVGPDNIRSGSDISYSLTVKNIGNTDIDFVGITVIVPAFQHVKIEGPDFWGIPSPDSIINDLSMIGTGIQIDNLAMLSGLGKHLKPNQEFNAEIKLNNVRSNDGTSPIYVQAHAIPEYELILQIISTISYFGEFSDLIPKSDLKDKVDQAYTEQFGLRNLILELENIGLLGDSELTLNTVPLDYIPTVQPFDLTNSSSIFTCEQIINSIVFGLSTKEASEQLIRKAVILMAARILGAGISVLFAPTIGLIAGVAWLGFEIWDFGCNTLYLWCDADKESLKNSNDSIKDAKDNYDLSKGLKEDPHKELKNRRRGFINKIIQEFSIWFCNTVVGAFDPNDITGPAGFGDENWIAADQVLPYTIRFENDSTLASAPALAVNITQQLDSTIDARSYRLGNFGFGDFVFTPPANSAYFSERLDVVDSLGVYVDITAGINLNTRTIFWNFNSVDPVSGQTPTNPFAGFLPVNDNSGRGEGFVSYTVAANSDVQSGDVINAEAKIVFDTNEPIDTPPIFHTIDADAPESAVDTLAAQTLTPSFQVSWSGADITPGAGLQSYDVYVARDSSDFELWLSDTTVTQEIYRGELGHTYRIYSIARDNTGNVQPLDVSAIVATRVDTTVVGIDEDGNLPKVFALHPNFPNPFNPTTTIRYDLPEPSKVKIVIYNVLGQKIKTLVNQRQPAGYKTIIWDGKNESGQQIASGFYFYRMVTEKFSKVRKMLLIR